MKLGYLIFAYERRVLSIALDDDSEAIHHALGCKTVEHGTTFPTENQLLVVGDELDGAPCDEFWVTGVPFPFSGDAILVGIDPQTGDIADRPAMSIDEFRRLIAFVGSHGRRRYTVLSRASDGLLEWEVR